MRALLRKLLCVLQIREQVSAANLKHGADFRFQESQQAVTV